MTTKKITKKQKEKIKALTWEYFWVQKVKEVSWTIGLIVGLLLLVGLLPYWIGNVTGDNVSKWCNNNWNDLDSVVPVECDTFAIWAEGFFYLFGCALIVWILYSWFSSNWRKAKDKARDEVLGEVSINGTE